MFSFIYHAINLVIIVTVQIYMYMYALNSLLQ